jgi:hypothetical protein
MSHQGKMNYLSEFHPEAIIMDGYDDCIIGVVERFGNEPIICYDKGRILKKLTLDGMSEEEAVEWFYFNQLGSYCGDRRPCFLETVGGVKFVDLDKLNMDL